MKVFIAGIAGFVGAGLARTLLRDGVEVHGLVRPSSDLWRIADIKSKLHLHIGDLLDKESIRAAIKKAKPDTLFHLGVYGSHPAYEKDRDMIMRTTIGSITTLLDAAKEYGVGMVINTGSSSEYGTKDHPMREDELIEPNSYYAVGKAAQTLYCQQFAREEKIPVITLRLFSVYGPYEEPTRFIPTLITKALANEDVALADPGIARDFIYLDDVVDVYRAAAKKPELSGEVFNVGSGVQHTLHEAFDTVIALTDSTSKALFGTYEKRSFDTHQWVADMNKTRAQLGVAPHYSLESGLRATIEWNKKYV
ncbi:NAD-dependent epimerase/dehydratase family protein [Candidatus Kaiserbacteria bacterium]|nr:NAD-dependent epimerase/dehydratase family protein [Candidatus Kaiserbacteria bacterium]